MWLHPPALAMPLKSPTAINLVVRFKDLPLKALHPVAYTAYARFYCYTFFLKFSLPDRHIYKQYKSVSQWTRNTHALRSETESSCKILVQMHEVRDTNNIQKWRHSCSKSGSIIIEGMQTMLIESIIIFALSNGDGDFAQYASYTLSSDNERAAQTGPTYCWLFLLTP